VNLRKDHYHTDPRSFYNAKRGLELLQWVRIEQSSKISGSVPALDRGGLVQLGPLECIVLTSLVALVVSANRLSFENLFCLDLGV